MKQREMSRGNASLKPLARPAFHPERCVWLDRRNGIAEFDLDHNAAFWIEERMADIEKEDNDA